MILIIFTVYIKNIVVNSHSNNCCRIVPSPVSAVSIEVKSIYTYEKDLKRNLEKEKAVLSAGYNFKFEIIEP
jgi:hypothetical protein